MNAIKAISVILIIIRVLTFAACGNESVDSPASPTSPTPPGDQSPSPGVNDTGVLDDMRYYSLSDRDTEAKIAMAIVDEALRSSQKPFQTQTAYPRFRVGNMAFIAVHTAPTVEVRDLSSTREYVVVVLSDEPHMVRTPNRELFARFASAVRADPDLMEPHQRIRTALILATGDADYISNNDGAEPTWTDEDGVLVISYYAYVSQMSSMVRPTVAACTLTVDENQNYTFEKHDVGYDVP